MQRFTRRGLLGRGLAGAVALAAGCAAPRGLHPTAADARAPGAASAPGVFRISLAQWSLHRSLRAGLLAPLDFPVVTARDFGLQGCEYVSTFLDGMVGRPARLAELDRRARDHGVTSLLIMVDGAGQLGAAQTVERDEALARHRPWLEAAAALGCHSVRVNAAGPGPPEELAPRVADSLHRLALQAADFGLDVIVENHGGPSSNGAWLAAVLAAADHPRVGSLPDFGNFTLEDGRAYDRYRGVAELLPFARAVSAKSHDFDAAGEETSTDYRRMLTLVRDSGYRGWIGIEYEGSRLSEAEGIVATRDLLERVRDELS